MYLNFSYSELLSIPNKIHQYKIYALDCSSKYFIKLSPVYPHHTLSLLYLSILYLYEHESEHKYILFGLMNDQGVENRLLYHIKLFNDHTLIVLKMLKPLCAVLTITPGNCLCQCNSLMSVCP